MSIERKFYRVSVADGAVFFVCLGRNARYARKSRHRRFRKSVSGVFQHFDIFYRTIFIDEQFKSDALGWFTTTEVFS